MTMKNLFITLAIAACIATLASCSKKPGEDEAIPKTEIADYFIAGQYDSNLSKTVNNLSSDYAIILHSDGSCLWVDPSFGQNTGTYTYGNGKLFVNITGPQLVADFTYKITNATLSDIEADGLPITSYALYKTPLTNSFTNNVYSGVLTQNNASSTMYLIFSDTHYIASTNGSAVPTTPYTLINNAVATINGGIGIFINYGGSLHMFFDQEGIPSTDKFYFLAYGTFSKQ
jgi:hypothetical protein